MSIEKKSLISTLKTTRKANVAKEDFAQVGEVNAGLKSPARHMAGRTVVTAGKITTGKVTTGKVTTGKVTTGKVTTGKVTTGKVTTGKVTTGRVR